ncbi:uncharacterized protein FIBRA_08413 [Fibroporia radiculosa]|uniref:Uncharacterized protein n=1 Tax=Fibroporia radiculosa TaxID=599839 RepID=J4I2Q2_9APHY|nr:uncharacterized protein FIBRA_08413 [Fibroporia radiculosa]CCM06172.1 predicted protein [Fibroporia radiculosa]
MASGSTNAHPNATRGFKDDSENTARQMWWAGIHLAFCLDAELESGSHAWRGGHMTGRWEKAWRFHGIGKEAESSVPFRSYDEPYPARESNPVKFDKDSDSGTEPNKDICAAF